MTATPEAMAAAARAFGEYAEYNRRVVADRRAATPRDDLMSVLVQAVIDGEKLSDDDLLQEGLLILVGGNETTRHVLTGGCEALCRNPEQLRALADDPSRIPIAVEEMLRWVTPIQNMNRTATRDTVLRGQTDPRRRQAAAALSVGEPRRARLRRSVPLRRRRATRIRTSPSASARTSASARASRASSCGCSSRSCCRASPTCVSSSDAPPPAVPSNFIRGLKRLEVEFTAR